MKLTKITNPKQCVYITTCKDRNICDGEGGIFYNQKRVDDCNKYESREERYLATLVARDEREIVE